VPGPIRRPFLVGPGGASQRPKPNRPAPPIPLSAIVWCTVHSHATIIHGSPGYTTCALDLSSHCPSLDNWSRTLIDNSRKLCASLLQVGRRWALLGRDRRRLPSHHQLMLSAAPCWPRQHDTRSPQAPLRPGLCVKHWRGAVAQVWRCIRSVAPLPPPRFPLVMR